jgi:hypothetical protein
MELLRTLLDRQPKKCCLGWFGDHRADPIPWTLPGLPPEIRVEQIEKPPGASGYTQAPFEFLVLDVDLMNGGMGADCKIASAILHEFGHFAGKQPRKKGEAQSDFVKACTYDCLAPEGRDDR